MLKIQDIAANGYERVVVFRDDCGFFCCIAVHHTKLGPALGGCRIFPYQSEHAALVDALRLSQGMTYKASLAGLNLGGGMGRRMRSLIGPKDIVSHDRVSNSP